LNLDVLLEKDKDIDLPRLAEVLDGLGHVGRVDTIRHWSGNVQARLFEAAKGFKPLTMDDFVPSSIEPMVEVIHHGKNSLPAFTHFEKRFCKPKPAAEGAEAPKEIWGYNEGFTRPFTGPGYFVLHEPEGRDDSAGELDIDYRRTPPSKPESWPTILSNKARLGIFVWNGMVDVMRGISSHVTIGRAIRGGRYVDAWFVLCREDR
jgi:hypothetical protein